MAQASFVFYGTYWMRIKLVCGYNQRKPNDCMKISSFENLVIDVCLIAHESKTSIDGFRRQFIDNSSRADIYI